jgi:hypothetical protein
MPIKGIKGGIGSKALGYGLGAAEAVAEATDAEFNQTVLLLHGDGSEGAGDTAALGDPNYKAFRDNSTSNHAITVNGDAYGNDFSPYYYADGYWSNFFDGTTDYLTVTQSAEFLFGTNAFTIEFWWYPLDLSTTAFYTLETTGGITVYYDGSNLRIDTRGGSNIILAADDPILNQWNHIVFTRSGTGANEGAIFLNGTRVAQGTISTNFTTNATLEIGEISGLSGYDLNGYLSNYRVVNGSNVYDPASSSITVPTAPLTAVTNTKLLTCQSNRFVDNSSTGHTISVNGTPKVSTNTPFTVTKTANVGSGFFDGTGDYINLNAGQSTTPFTLDGEFTFEAWVYITGTADFIIDTAPASAATDQYLRIRYDATYSRVQWWEFGAATLSSDTDSVQENTWCHISLVRNSSNVIKFFIDGVEQATTPTNSNQIECGDARPMIASDGYNDGANYFNGYIADVNIIKGSAKYNTDFTPPTSTVSADTNTNLLTCQYSGAVRNVGFLDDSKYNNQITRNGDVSMGTFSPFSLEDGYWSTFHNTHNDAHVRFAGTSATDFNLDDGASWCVEFFLYMNDNSVAYQRVAEQYNDNDYWAIKFNSTGNGTGNGKICIGRTDTANNGVLESASAIPENQWVHVAFTNDGSTLRLFVDGALSNSASSWTQPWINASSGTPSLQLGNYRSINGYQTRGYISNFRIVKGSSVYTSPFTVPTEPLTAIANTVLLCSQSNRHLDNSTNGYTATSGPTSATPPKVLPFSPFAPTRSYSKNAVGGSAYFDNNGDYLETATSNSLDFNANQFCIEWWEYRTARDSFDVIMHIGFNASTSYGLVIGYNGDRLYWSSNGSSWDVLSNVDFFGSETRYNNQWYHCVLTRDSSNQFRSFINGVLRYTTSVSTSIIYQAANAISIGSGQSHATTHDYQGYLSGINISNGSIPSRYQTSSTTVNTSVFTPPTAPTTSDTDTVLLLNYANAGIIDHTMKNNLETEGNTRISGQQTKFGTGSMYFDGTGDYIQLPFNENLNFGTGSFTWEAWVHPTDISGIDGIYATSGGSGGNPKFVVHLNAGTPSVHYGAVSSLNSYTTATSAISADTWTYLAYVRNGTTWTWYINGVASGTGSETGADLSFTTQPTFVGYGGETYFTPFNGYIDELRVTKGVARYTGSSFTVPTQAFANK